MVCVYAPLLLCCGVPGCESVKRWRWQRRTLSTPAGLSWCGTAKATSAVSRHGRVGVGPTPAMAGPAPRTADRPLVLRDQWSDVRSPLGTRRRASRATSSSRACRSQTPVRATSTPPRARSRTSTRGRRPERDSASAPSRKSWGDFGLSPRHRQRGGDRSRALAATADDSGSSRAAPLALPRGSSSLDADQMPRWGCRSVAAPRAEDDTNTAAARRE
jgi:hypothetical protein